MTQTATRTQARKPASKPAPARKIRLILAAAGDMPAVARIETEGKAALYAVREVAGQPQARMFCVREVVTSDEVETYTCYIGEKTQSCTCQGWNRHRKCKHADGLAVLVKIGKI